MVSNPEKMKSTLRGSSGDGKPPAGRKYCPGLRGPLKMKTYILASYHSLRAPRIREHLEEPAMVAHLGTFSGEEQPETTLRRYVDLEVRL
jgi:hypothetical protein